MRNFYSFYYKTDEGLGSFKKLAMGAAMGAALSGGVAKGGEPATIPTGKPTMVEKDTRPIPLDPANQKVAGQKVDVILKSTDNKNRWIVCYKGSIDPVIIDGKPYIVTVRWDGGDGAAPGAGDYKVLGTINTNDAGKWWIEKATVYNGN